MPVVTPMLPISPMPRRSSCALKRVRGVALKGRTEQHRAAHDPPRRSQSWHAAAAAAGDAAQRAGWRAAQQSRNARGQTRGLDVSAPRPPATRLRVAEVLQLNLIRLVVAGMRLRVAEEAHC